MRRNAILTFLTGFLLAASPALASEDLAPAKSPTPNTPADAKPANPAETPHAEPPRPDNSQEYVVQKGDTLTSIAAEQLGSAEKWRVIASANGIDDPQQLRIGQKLVIPTEESQETRG